MNELFYPFDASWIISNKRKIRRDILAGKDSFLEKKVAVLGGATTANFVQILDLFLLNSGIKATFYESKYGRYYEDAVFGNDEIEAYQPDIIYIFTSNRNIKQYPLLDDSKETVDALLNAEIEKYINIWDQLHEKYACPIIQNNFEMPIYRLLGNKDAADIHGKVNYLSRLNMKFYEYAQTHEDFYICDINYLSADYGLKEWSDPFYWYMYKCALCVDAIPYLAHNVANIIKSIFGRNKKGLVLDLDNTLWGGVIGDDGVDNIKLGNDVSDGQAYVEFQKYLKENKQLGILLNIDSKNDENNAMEGLNHPDGVLKPGDFTVIKANWIQKDVNLVEIANELNIAPESLVFIDDNPAERHIVSEQLKGVSAPEIGESHQYIINIDRSGFFEATIMSEDDAKRNEMYQKNARRARLKATFNDYGEYLQSLQMRAVIKPFESVYLTRIAQLTNKSNQFNLTARRYTRAEIEAISVDKNYITLYGRLEDRFGDNGVVSVVIGRVEDHVCHIDLWLMSCRVLKRDMEHVMMDEFVARCKLYGITQIIGYYCPTFKNEMVRNFYKNMGFDKNSENEDTIVWHLNSIYEYKLKNKYIKVEDA